MRILVCGANGQVGHEIVSRAAAFGLEALGTTRDQVDITQRNQVEDAVGQLRPGLIINAAAYTHVDHAETHADQAYAVNRDGAAFIASAARDAGIPLLHISTDYVFPGTASVPYRETDVLSPTGVYGASKAAGEEAVRSRLDQHLILRASWIFGAHGHNFVKTMLRLARQRDHLSVVSDQIGCPTHAGSLADTLLELAARYARQGTLAWGTYHYGGQPACSWFDFAEEIFRQAEASKMLLKRPTVTAIGSEQYPTPARRPAWSVLDCTLFEKTFGLEAPDWRRDLQAVLAQLRTSRSTTPAASPANA